MGQFEDLKGKTFGFGGNGNGNGNGNGDANAKESTTEEQKIYSVREACRLHMMDNCCITGSITSASELFKMARITSIECGNDQCSDPKSLTAPKNPVYTQFLSKHFTCSNCDSDMRYDYDYVNATQVELQDLTNYNDMDKMRVLLFDNDTLDVIIGDTVKVIGNIEIIQTKYGKGKTVSFMFANKIIYEGKEEIKLSESDIQELVKFKDENYKNLIPKLIEITTPSVIGYPLMKEGLLLSAASTIIDTPKRKKRINMILIGPAGLDKTGFLYAATELVRGSSFEGAQSSSGLSLTAIVIFEDDTKILSLGPIPRCQGAFCAINELNRMNPKDQGQLLDPSQEGLIPLNKYNTHAKIRSSTTIIASANPVGEDWQDNVVSMDQVTIIPQLLDRFDLKFILKKNKDFAESRKYADLKSLDIINDENEEQLEKQKKDLEFLQKYILYAKQFNPKMTEQARQMINEYFAAFEYTNAISKRPFETLYNLAFARAKLKFKKEVDADDAHETIDYYSKVTEDYNSQVEKPLNPRDVTFTKCVELLQKHEPAGITVEELADMACESSPQINAYIGPDRSMRNNHKLTNIIEMLRLHSQIKPIRIKPLVLRWFNPDSDSNSTNLCDPCDLCDATSQVEKNISEPNNEEKIFSDEKTTSHTSHRSYSNSRLLPLYYSEGAPYPVRVRPTTMTREQIEEAIELAAKESKESVMYLCPICKFGQFKTQKEFHKKSCMRGG